METQERLKIAIQKKGRLSDDSLKLLRECGISVGSSTGKLQAQATDFPVDLLFLRDDDIPQYVQDGVADIGMLGENEVLEKDKNVQIIERLGFSKCRLSLALPKESDYTGPTWFSGKKIATSYPNVTRKFLETHNVDTEIEYIGGSVEIAPSIGLADGICDIVSSGSTLFTNGLKEVEVILKSEAVMICSTALSPEKKAILDRLQFRLQSVQNAKNNKYILLNAPNNKIEQISKILPGIKSPTVTALAEEGWSALQSVVDERKFWDVIEELRAAGAEGILIVPIDKMIL
jgi:ATP phosphoribosyltransferase